MTLRILVVGQFAAALIALSGLAAAQEPPKPGAGAEQKPPPKPPAEAQAPVLQIEKSTKPAECVIKPVMTDDELRACGARIPENRGHNLAK
jgi:hypothetical protein